jgi:hypothetical protein
VKKIISIGVALALLTMVVVPGAAAAYTPPETYSKVPFAIVQSGFELIGILITAAGSEMGLPDWLNAALMNDIGGWAGGPLSWTVDMLAWGIALTGDVVAALDPIITAVAGELPIDLIDLADVFDTVACGLMTCWSATNCTGDFDPCGLLP